MCGGVPTYQEYDADYGLGEGHNPPVCGLPSGRWSQLDMMNFSLRTFVIALMALSDEVRRAASHRPDEVLTDADKARLIGNLQFIAERCRQISLPSAEYRLQRCFMTLQSTSPPIYGILVGELVTLNEAINDDINTEYFYHYPRQKALLIIANAEWLPVFNAFPSSRKEVEEGIDCYAFGHPTAAIFHMMRIAELGMRALARERQVTFPNRPLEWAEWEHVIDGIESKGRDAARALPRGPQRDAAGAFYTAAVAQLRAFKETRNRVMHMRGAFDDLDAQRAMNQVRDFMVGLCRKIGEKTRHPIRRWP
jgi:hypothetical protein